MKFIVDTTKTDGFLQTHFKFLGRWIGVDLEEQGVQRLISTEYRKLLDKTDALRLDGLIKLWIYQHIILAKISWGLMVHDLPISAIKELQQNTNVYLKKWCGVTRSADPGILYRPKEHLGLGLTSLTTHYKKMQIVKCHLCKNSEDAEIRMLYEQKAEREKHLRTRWKATKELSKAEEVVSHARKFPSQTDKCGLGFIKGRYKSTLNLEEQREACTRAVEEESAATHVAHAHTLALQGVWTRWLEVVSPFDLSWRNLIYGPGKRIISFVLNASINMLPTPDILKIMNYRDTAACKLCDAPQCTLFHILSHCVYALVDKRYFWRHDSVLLSLKSDIAAHVDRVNSTQIPKLSGLYESFVREGARMTKRKATAPHVLDTARDWKLLVDFMGDPIVFPPHICATNQRPDIVLWSDSARHVILIELTCPAEEKILQASSKKKSRYMELLSMIQDNKWKVDIFTVEAGVRGFISHSFRTCLKKLGMTSSSIREACKKASQVVARCSYAIWLARNSKTWIHRTLVQPNTEISGDTTWGRPGCEGRCEPREVHPGPLLLE